MGERRDGMRERRDGMRERRDDMRELKNEINEGIDILDYLGGKLFIRWIFAVLAIGVIFTYAGSEFKKYRTEKDREIFKESTAYNESAASFLSDAHVQYNDAETDEDRASIMQYVRMRYPNLDDDSIENDILRQFYNKCILGGN